ncbi:MULTISPECIES: ABC transporter ATP-binding protein [Pantoea]|jgi:lipopolysaccharide transport system ATP-binding protein|uniref:ABC transporter ATP-binding protein n=1 Tax=Pantoea TaxID=53335 RepID=UPI0007361F24|nr:MULTISPECIES: ABC transporter ATP-binding protein [Pantoea]KAA6101501.1 ABC transporter ATP-binding protein [Pantoea sp. B_9]KAA6111216.1 ABC transporter ATP-binding protein [Pantoea sp. B_10]KTS01181.1 sugar ABC transporter ATP-binding protein [Pantoea dispersa]MBU6517954.1 ABC transporter ATP-binding protein [Pantoea sp. B270]QZY96204.1 ABC transporter ATP-binding protein [Pantoea dispersa]
MGKITVNNVGKAYKQYPTRWSRLAEWFLPGKRKRHKLKWVLENISFEVHPGEALGIIGINGAGKSTLLKMITGTTQPTTGKISLEGRVAAMLELGMGFHPDFTGRQNVIMSGQLLGFSLEEIYQLMPGIEEFAEIGAYIDQPVRVYSSGMQMRLAFSVATAVRPDILIVDEALSVGDAYFQHKSFNRIREFSRAGTTLLIVSHDKQSIQSICDKAILLNRGKLEMEGDPESVMDYYNALLADKQNQKIEQVELADGSIQTVSGSGEATVKDIRILNQKGDSIEFIDVGEAVTLKITVVVNENLPRLVLGYGIKDRLGQVIYGTNTDLKKQAIIEARKGSEYVFNIRFNANLGPGSYSIQTALVSTDTHLVNNYEWRDLAMVFNIININKPHFAGCAWIDPDIEIN